jgi:hypothetical protein
VMWAGLRSKCSGCGIVGTHRNRLWRTQTRNTGERAAFRGGTVPRLPTATVSRVIFDKYVARSAARIYVLSRVSMTRRATSASFVWLSCDMARNMSKARTSSTP